MKTTPVGPLGMLLIIVFLLLSACTSQSPAQPTPPAQNNPDEGVFIGPTWGWVQTTTGDSVFASNGPERYTLKFQADGTYQGKLDCNQMSGTYMLGEDGSLQLTLGPSTLIGCPPDSLDTAYAGYLGNAAALQVGEDGLEIELKDGSVMHFTMLP